MNNADLISVIVRVCVLAAFIISLVVVCIIDSQHKACCKNCKYFYKGTCRFHNTIFVRVRRRDSCGCFIHRRR